MKVQRHTMSIWTLAFSELSSGGWSRSFVEQRGDPISSRATSCLLHDHWEKLFVNLHRSVSPRTGGSKFTAFTRVLFGLGFGRYTSVSATRASSLIWLLCCSFLAPFSHTLSEFNGFRNHCNRLEVRKLGVWDPTSRAPSGYRDGNHTRGGSHVHAHLLSRSSC